jgi:hypothetical protein
VHSFSLVLREIYRLRESEKTVMRKICVGERVEIAGEMEKIT